MVYNYVHPELTLLPDCNNSILSKSTLRDHHSCDMKLKKLKSKMELTLKCTMHIPPSSPGSRARTEGGGEEREPGTQ